MKFTVLTSLAILIGAGYAFAADNDAAPSARPGAVPTGVECVTTWQISAGDELDRFKTARRIVTFQQVDNNQDGKVSVVQFLEACKLGLVNAIARGHQLEGW